MKKTNSLVPLILGIIGGVFGIIGGSCTTFCAGVADAVGVGGYLVWGILSLVAAIVGLVGGCVARKTGTGSLLMVIAAIVDIVCMIFLGLVWTILVSLILFLIGGIIGLVKHE